MSETFITVISVILVAVLLFVVPIMATANQNDNITKTQVQTKVSEFVNTAAKEGKITQENYDNLVQSLYSTGNSYDVALEVQTMDTNPIKGNVTALGENIYYSVYTNQILQKLDAGEPYPLKQGDYVRANVKNTNVTMGTSIKNFVYSIMGKDTIAIEVSDSALVSTTGKI